MITWFHRFDEQEAALAREGDTLAKAVEALNAATATIASGNGMLGHGYLARKP